MPPPVSDAPLEGIPMFLEALRPTLAGIELETSTVDAMLAKMEMAMQSMVETTKRVASQATDDGG
eukprot:SAG11_NODE_12893_length_680_cov_1.273666_1_plen_64_part_10